MDLANIPAEQNVLGALLRDNGFFVAVAGVLDASDFYEPLHRQIFTIATELIAEGREASPITVKPYLPDGKVGNLSVWEYLVKLVSEVATYDVGSTSRAIVDDAVWRKVVSACESAAQAGKTRSGGISPLPVLDELEQAMAELRIRLKDQSGLVGLADAITSSFDSIGDAAQRKETIGFPWGFRALLDVANEPMQRGALYGFMADSSGGKTSMALQIIRANAEAGVPCLFLSFEQTREQCVQQMVSQATGYPSSRLRSGQLTESEMEKVYAAHQDLRRLPIAVQKVFDKTAKQLGILMRAFCRIQGPALIVIDHAKRISPNPKTLNLADQVNETYGALKNLALETNSAMLLLMQRNSKAIERDNPRPIRADAYGGQSGPENLDAFVALYRQEQHLAIQADMARSEEKKDELLRKLEQIKGHAKVYGLKCRYGADGRVASLRFKGSCTKFYEEDLPEDPMGLM